MAMLIAGVYGQDLRVVVESKLKEAHLPGLSTACPIDDDWVAARVFREYGAMYVAEKPAVVPSRCIVESDVELLALQRTLNPRTETIEGVAVTLQEPALNALIRARADAEKLGLAITPRDGPLASARTYTQTVELWRSRFEPGLDHWVQKGRIKAAEAAEVRDLPVRKQVERVLMWERRGIYFSTNQSKSILYSVAIPGGSQHNFLLAFDIEQYDNLKVRQIMADHGWFQTVRSDEPHFTYLGIKAEDLPKNGLRSVLTSLKRPTR